MKYHGAQRIGTGGRSLPPRGAWIEITLTMAAGHLLVVAPPAGSVD